MHDAPVGRNLPGRYAGRASLARTRLSFSTTRALLSTNQFVVSGARAVNASLLDSTVRRAATTFHFLTTSTLRLTDTEPWSLSGTSTVPSVLIGSGS